MENSLSTDILLQDKEGRIWRWRHVQFTSTAATYIPRPTTSLRDIFMFGTSWQIALSVRYSVCVVAGLMDDHLPLIR